mmetsp:Transcript_37486/g.74371  ORF Transcript_37486/g.74371 Transcript_37486/m.74371 type:complete len:239 (-) Transcript_37486:666-1382(-)
MCPTPFSLCGTYGCQLDSFSTVLTTCCGVIWNRRHRKKQRRRGLLKYHWITKYDFLANGHVVRVTQKCSGHVCRSGKAADGRVRLPDADLSLQLAYKACEDDHNWSLQTHPDCLCQETLVGLSPVDGNHLVADLHSILRCCPTREKSRNFEAASLCPTQTQDVFYWFLPTRAVERHSANSACLHLPHHPLLLLVIHLVGGLLATAKQRGILPHRPFWRWPRSRQDPLACLSAAGNGRL